MNIYRDILETVIENDRLIYFTEEELEEEIEFEARERGLSDEQMEEAVAYAKEHYDVWQARKDRITDALEAAIIAAQEVAGDHPSPSCLLRDLEVQSLHGCEYLAIAGDAWDFWPEDVRDKAFKAAEEAFEKHLPWLSQ